jgi:type II secretory pathway component PulF
MLGNSNTIANRNSAVKAENGFIALLRKLNSIQVGPRTAGDPTKIKARPLAELLRLLLMLLENGLSLPKALQSLAEDRSTRKFSHVLNRLRMTIEAGGTLSQGMQHYPKTFTQMQVQQIRMGEQSGAMERALARVCEQMERHVALRKRITNKVSYPILITVAGSGLMIFMCVVVIPEFETVYSGSGVDLPVVTHVVTGMSRMVIGWGWLTIPLSMLAAFLWAFGRSRPLVARSMDAFFLKLPIVGPWLRDVAVLQFSEGILSMVECGYRPVEAVDVAADCVRNREVRAAVDDVRRGVQRGEKLSVELRKHENYFAATLCQLVGVGEQSGNFPKAMRGTCDHLRERLESRIDASVGMLEPTLTILLAIAIGGIVLSIYMPMFHMFEVLE